MTSFSRAFSTSLVIALSGCVSEPKVETAATIEVSALSEIYFGLMVSSAQDVSGVQLGGIGLYLWLLDFDYAHGCPEVPAVVATIGSATALAVTDGGYSTEYSADAFLTPTRDCDDIYFEWSGDWSDVAGAAEVVLTDDSGSVLLPVESAFSARELFMVTPTDGVITEGGEVSLSYTPADDVLSNINVYMASSTLEDLEVSDLTATVEDGFIDVELPATLDPALDVLGANVDYEQQDVDDGKGVKGLINRYNTIEFAVTVQ